MAVCGIIDPPRDEAIEAVRECQQAGIVVKMITGDHAVTAKAIADELKIRTEGGVMSGHELERISDRDMEQAVREVDVFARPTPEHKLRLVKAIQANGHVVAMTGDGVNDAPALKRAGLLGSRAVLVAVAVLVVLQALFTYAPPMQFLFGTAALQWAEWGRILAFGLLLFVLVELEKAWLKRRDVKAHA